MKRYDVFFCYASADRPAVKRIAERLHSAGVSVFFDQWGLVPGDPSMPGLEAALAQSGACAVFVGAQPGRWQAAEMRVAMEQHLHDGGFRVIPVLLDGGSDEAVRRFSAFLHGMTALDFRPGVDEEAALRLLVGAVRGEPTPPEAPRVSREEQLLTDHLLTEGRRYAAARLPLPDRQGTPSRLPVAAVRIDVPLQATYLHGVPASSEESRDAEAVHWMTRMRSMADIPLTDGTVQRTSSAVSRRRVHRIGEFLGNRPRLVLVGDPGSGKTTLLQHIAFTYADQRLRERSNETFASLRSVAANGKPLPERPWIPVTLFCRNMAAWKPDEGLAGLLHAQLLRLGEEPQKSRALSELLLERLQTGEAVLLVDGLDEMQSAARMRLAELLANRQELSVIITSRPVGFHNTAELLADSFDHLNVLPLEQEDKEQFVRVWAAAVSSTPAEATRIEDKLLPHVSHDRNTSRLCDNVLFITLFAEMLMTDDAPRHLLGAYRRTVEIMVERQRDTGSPALTINEIWPCLEHLACRMRSVNEQKLAEDRAAALIGALYAGAMRTSEFRRREPHRLVHDLLEQLAIMNDAGPMIDDDGFERRMIQFFHPSFQEYFAAQAVLHGRCGAQHGNLIDRLRELVKEFSIEERPIEALGGIEREPVTVGQWQEVVRLVILALTTQPARDGATSDEAFRMLLSLAKARPREGRALVVFALQCLADEPDVTLSTRHDVYDAAIGVLHDLDGFNNAGRTRMDVALRALRRSRFGSEARQRFLESYVRTRGPVRNRVGSAIGTTLSENTFMKDGSGSLEILRSLLQRLDSADAVDGTVAALELMDAFFLIRTSNSAVKFAAIPEALVRETAAKLVAAVERSAEPDASMVHAATWALAWVVNAYDALPEDRTPLIASEQAVMRRIALDPARDEMTRVRCLAAFAASSDTDRTAPTPAESLQRWALVADGTHPFAPAGPPSRPAPAIDPAPFLPLVSTSSIHSNRRAAISLCRLGCFVEDLVDPLFHGFQDPTGDVDIRGEALFYLTRIGGEKVVDALLAGAVTERRENDRFPYPEHCFLGLIGLGQAEVFERFLTLEGRSAEATQASQQILGRGVVSWTAIGHYQTVLIRAGITPIHLVRCKDSGGRDCYFFVLCSMRRARELQEAFKAGPVTLTDYGEIVGSGFGREPSTEVKRSLLQRYGFDAEGM